MRSETSALGAKTNLKQYTSKIGNWLLFWIWIILSIWIFSIIYATYTWTTQTPVWAGSGLTSTIWNDMINNMGYLKENVEWVAGKFWTLTSWKMCTSDWVKVDCNTNVPVSGITTEVDPKVWTLTSWKTCTSDWSKVNCTTTIADDSTPDWDSGRVYYANTSPWLKSLTHNLWVLPRQVQWWYSNSSSPTWHWPVAFGKNDHWSSPLWVWFYTNSISFTIRSDRTLYRAFNWSAWSDYYTGYYRILLWK